MSELISSFTIQIPVNGGGLVLAEKTKNSIESRNTILEILQTFTNDQLSYAQSNGTMEIKIINPAKPGSINKPSGTTLIRELIGSGKTITLALGVAGSKNFTRRVDRRMDADNLNPKARAQNGIKENSYVNFDPTSNLTKALVDPATGNVVEFTQTPPSTISLAHELIHAHHLTKGDSEYDETTYTYQTASGNVTENGNIEEFRTVGLKGVRKGDITENQIREEQGLRKRGALVVAYQE